MSYKNQMNYRKKNIKSRTIDFGKNEYSLYDYSKTINFSGFIKDMLREYKDIPEVMCKYVR